MKKSTPQLLAGLTLVAVVCGVASSCSIGRYLELDTMSPLVTQAKDWDGRYYRHGVKAQCANWVTTVVEEVGLQPPVGSAAARAWMAWGEPISIERIKPGDVLVLKNTYKLGPSHVGIYVGEGEFMHRSTSGKPVQLTQMSRYQVAAIRRG